MARSPNTPVPDTPSGAPNPFAATPQTERPPSPVRVNLVASPPTEQDIYQFRISLRDAAKRCQGRGLYYAARWASEQLVKLTPSVPSNGGAMDTSLTIPILETEKHVPQGEEDACLLAMSYFHLKEYDRAAWTLREFNGEKALFIKSYSKYLYGEKRKAEQELGHEVHLESKRSNNGQLHNILSIFQTHEQDMDSFCWYLYGMVYSRLKLTSKALEAFLQSLHKYPYNWSVWEELAALIESKDLQALVPRLPEGYMRKFFFVHLMAQKAMAAEEFVQNHTDLSAMFPNSSYLNLQYAVSYYNRGKYESALEYFDTYREQEPLSLECMDIHSHVLYTLNAPAKLSVLAHKAFELDRYRPETCVAIGNYFSIRRDHFRALDYFQRALRLRPNYAEALIMMGDEYIELKNSNAALENYRKAADMAPHDYRTWFGVGKAFDLLAMSDHALPYYQKAAACRPHHSQTWKAMGEVFQNAGKHSQALMCYKRALVCANKDASLFLFIGRLYEKSPSLGDSDQAAFYYKCWIQELRSGTNDKENYWFDWENALTFLAEYYKGKGLFADAEVYTAEISHTERGKALNREMRAMKDRGYSQASTTVTARHPQFNTPTPSMDPTPSGPSNQRSAFSFPGGTCGDTWVTPHSSVPGRHFGASAPGSGRSTERSSRTGSRQTSVWSTPATDDAR